MPFASRIFLENRALRGKRFRGRGVDGTADRAWIGEKRMRMIDDITNFIFLEDIPPGINRRNEKFRFGKIQLVIHQAPSGMVSLTAENGLFRVNAFPVQISLYYRREA